MTTLYTTAAVTPSLSTNWQNFSSAWMGSAQSLPYFTPHAPPKISIPPPQFILPASKNNNLSISSAGTDGLEVLPSKMFKTSWAKQYIPRKLKSPLFNERSYPLDVEALKARRVLSLARARRMKSAALESQAIHCLQESLLLKGLIERGADLNNLPPQAAIDLARSARDVLLAAERLALTKVQEAEKYLDALKDSLDAAHTRVTQAELQLKSILTDFQQKNIPIKPTPNLTFGLHDPLPFSIPLSDCDLDGAHTEENFSEGDFELDFQEDCNEVESEPGEYEAVWEPEENALDEYAHELADFVLAVAHGPRLLLQAFNGIKWSSSDSLSPAQRSSKFPFLVNSSIFSMSSNNHYAFPANHMLMGPGQPPQGSPNDAHPNLVPRGSKLLIHRKALNPRHFAISSAPAGGLAHQGSSRRHAPAELMLASQGLGDTLSASNLGYWKDVSSQSASLPTTQLNVPNLGTQEVQDIISESQDVAPGLEYTAQVSDPQDPQQPLIQRQQPPQFQRPPQPHQPAQQQAYSFLGRPLPPVEGVDPQFHRALEAAARAFVWTALQKPALFWAKGSAQEGVLIDIASQSLQKIFSGFQLPLDDHIFSMFLMCLDTEWKRLLEVARNEIALYFVRYFAPVEYVLGPMSQEEGIATNVAFLTLSDEDVPSARAYLRLKLGRNFDNFEPPVMAFTEDPDREGRYNHPVLRNILYKFLASSPITEEGTDFETLDVKDWLKSTVFATYLTLIEHETGQFQELTMDIDSLAHRLAVFCQDIDAVRTHDQTGPAMLATLRSWGRWGKDVYGRPGFSVDGQTPYFNLVRPIMRSGVPFSFSKTKEPNNSPVASSSSNMFVTTMTVPCEAGCGRRFATVGSMHKHLLTTKKKCGGYLQGKLRDLGLHDADIPTAFDLGPEEDLEDDWDQSEEAPYEPFIFDFLNPGINEFHFMPPSDCEESSEDEEMEDGNALAGPGPSTAAFSLLQGADKAPARNETVFTDQADERYIVWTEGAGQILRKVAPPTYMPAEVLDAQGDVDMNTDRSPFFPFSSELDWRVAQWAVKDGPGQNAFDRLLEVPGVVEKLGLSFHNMRSLHQKIDAIPERAGAWQTKQLFFNDHPDEKYTIRFRDPVEAIKSLWKDPKLSPSMVYAPAKFYESKKNKNRIFAEMWHAKWWHACQSKLPVGATMAPVIIATDKTQLTQFSGSKSAYPVYLTIGNIPKALRRKPSKKACVLIGYLSVEKINRKQMTERAHRSKIQRLFHESMRIILESLKRAGHEGVEMTSADGAVRLVFPIISCYVADYPEQCLVTCSKYGTCVKCQARADELGDPEPKEARSRSWTLGVLSDAQAAGGQDTRAFYDLCMSHEVAGGVPNPFWTDFPLCDIHHSITPDVLHQLYQGVLKHLISWCQRILTPEELDCRIRCLPQGHGLRRFKNGFSALSQISGPERKNMAKILLGCLIGSIPTKGVAAITALLDFIYLAQYTSHNTETLGFLEDALERFNRHRDYFIETGVRDNLDIPKFHSLHHYVEAIKLFGTTDNYNTELFERLHIDFAKLGWRASNHRDEFPQMVRWLSRREKIAAFEVHQNLARTQTLGQTPTTQKATVPISLPKHPNIPGRDISVVQDKHDAPDFEFYLKQYLNKFTDNPLGPRQLDRLDRTPLTFRKVDIYNMFRFHPEELQDDEEEKDLVKAIAKSAKLPHGRFDTVVVLVDEEAESTGLAGTRVGRVKVIFSLPKKLDTIFGPRDLPSRWPQGPLAYVEWYSPLAGRAEEKHGMMYRVTRQWNAQQRRRPGAVVPLRHIRQSCMLFPAFPRGNVPADWSPENVLDKATAFFVNNWLSKYSYQTLY
ncbi:hypothetical protein CVT26_000650 [Gymnopilus dilepis]|uniref:DUF6830 domain-containing protein n=1 Tax=Gymnopilus dilepis TaxID=231916 RepID=A0A409Y2Q1_9AGAR|nr:hypothetical protein CVT26_000650 [Gymnopilus dilepis]